MKVMMFSDDGVDRDQFCPELKVSMLTFSMMQITNLVTIVIIHPIMVNIGVRLV